MVLSSDKPMFFFTHLLPVRMFYVKSVGSLRLNAEKLGVAEESPRKKLGKCSRLHKRLLSNMCPVSPRHQEFANLADKYCILLRRYLQT